MSERYVVTGAGGCIGAWVVRRLLDEGEDVVALDVAGASRHRLRQLDADGVTSAICDVTDRAAVVAAVDGATASSTSPGSRSRSAAPTRPSARR